jgi:hypothetical protein
MSPAMENTVSPHHCYRKAAHQIREGISDVYSQCVEGGDGANPHPVLGNTLRNINFHNLTTDFTHTSLRHFWGTVSLSTLSVAFRQIGKCVGLHAQLRFEAGMHMS